jgi:hypothetical protein
MTSYYAPTCSQASDVTTPMVPAEKVTSTDGDRLSPDDATRYQSVVGGLQYLSLTHPNISLCVNRVCQYMSPPNYGSLDRGETYSSLSSGHH